MSGLRDRLQRLTKSRSLTESAEHDKQSAAGSKPDSASCAWARINAEVCTAGGGSFIRRTIDYPLSYVHGRYTLGQLQQSADLLAYISSNKEHVTAQQLLFLDTETTGLGIGAGNVPFMIGFGFLNEDRFTVEQLFMRNPAEEYSALLYLQQKLALFSHLVTYNGRTFDWPVLKNRFVLHRLAEPQDPGHIDFLYPSRSLWRKTLTTCKLSVVETEKLGVERVDDLPGAEAPARYMEFLSSSSVAVIEPVFIHNERDIVSLAALAAAFHERLAGDPACDRLSVPEEMLQQALWLDRLGRRKTAENVLSRLLSSGAVLTGQQLLDAASLYKRWRQYDAAASLWRQCTEGRFSGAINRLEPLIELAVYYEHRLRDPLAALAWTEKARSVLERRLALHRGRPADRMLLAQIDHRMQRLRRKLGRPQQQSLLFS